MSHSLTKKEKVSKQLVKKLNPFPKEKYDFWIVWKTKKVKQLSSRKICILYVKSIMMSVIANKIAQVKLNEMLLLAEMSMKIPQKDSEPTKHLFQHPDHVCQWKVLISAPMGTCKRKNLEAFFIWVRHLTLNKQEDSKKLTEDLL